MQEVALVTLTSAMRLRMVTPTSASCRLVPLTSAIHWRPGWSHRCPQCSSGWSPRRPQSIARWPPRRPHHTGEWQLWAAPWRALDKACYPPCPAGLWHGPPCLAHKLRLSPDSIHQSKHNTASLSAVCGVEWGGVHEKCVTKISRKML